MKFVVELRDNSITVEQARTVLGEAAKALHQKAIKADRDGRANDARVMETCIPIVQEMQETIRTA